MTEEKPVEKVERDPAIGSEIQANDFQPDGTAKHDGIIERGQMDRKIMTGEAPAAEYMPKSEREYMAAHEYVEAPIPPQLDGETTEPGILPRKLVENIPIPAPAVSATAEKTTDGDTD